MRLGRNIFYDVITGQLIVDTGQWDNVVRQKTIEENIESYSELTERNRDTFDVLELPYGAYAQDFAICTGYRVNPETRELEFNYPDPNNPDVEQPYIQPLSDAINEQMDYLVDVDFRLSMIELGL